MRRKDLSPEGRRAYDAAQRARLAMRKALKELQSDDELNGNLPLLTPTAIVVRDGVLTLERLP